MRTRARARTRIGPSRTREIQRKWNIEERREKREERHVDVSNAHTVCKAM